MTYNKNNNDKNKITTGASKHSTDKIKKAIKYTPRNVLFKRAYYNF